MTTTNQSPSKQRHDFLEQPRGRLLREPDIDKCWEVVNMLYCGQPRDAAVHQSTSQPSVTSGGEGKCKCPHPGAGLEYNCDDAKQKGFPSHCPCPCHKSSVKFSETTGGAYADMEDVVESELKRLTPTPAPVPVEGAPERIWIDRSQIGAHRQHGNYYLFNFDEVTAVEYVRSDLQPSSRDEWRASGCLVLTTDAELGEVAILTTTTAQIAAQVARDHNHQPSRLTQETILRNWAVCVLHGLVEQSHRCRDYDGEDFGMSIQRLKDIVRAAAVRLTDAEKAEVNNIGARLAKAADTYSYSLEQRADIRRLLTLVRKGE